VQFLIGSKTEHLQPIIRIGEYIDFTLKFLLGAGAVFELPLIIILLSRMGILQPASLAKFRKYAFLISFLLAAIITPTPDAFNMTLMAMPTSMFCMRSVFWERASSGGSAAQLPRT
jgi:sec-independent protein translocase protein TatC